MWWILLVRSVIAEVPADLDGLVRLALERDPEAAATELDARAAAEEAAAAGRPMNPMAMVGADSLGAMAGDPDPTMFMVGAEQMLRGWGEARAAADLARVAVTRAEADRARIEADLQLRLAQAAARLRALDAEQEVLTAQIRAAEALWQAGVRRWASGAARPGMGAMGGGESMGGSFESELSTAPPTVQAGRTGGAMGMPGMGGGGGKMQAPTGGMRGMDGGGMDSGAMTGGAMDSGGMGGGAMGGGTAAGSTFPDLLRVEAEVARLKAEVAALDARLAGEVAVLGRFVGAEAAARVRAQPDAYLRAASAGVPPEIGLADAECTAAEADLRVAQARLAPDLALRVSVGIMPDGMVQGVNVMVGTEVPVWGANTRARDAATARAAAAARRADGVDRELAAATDAARAAETAAAARGKMLREVAVPRAEAAWRAALAQYAAAQTTLDEALGAWEGLLAAQRDLVVAERDEALRAAERARVEVR